MKRFVLRFGLFILPMVLLAYGSDLFISKRLKQIKSYKEGEFSVWNDLYDGKIDAQIAIYGSSRAWLHIDPAIVEDSLHIPTYNLGINSHNFWLEYFRHTLLLKYNKKPRLIIHTLGMATVEKRVDLFNADQFLPYMLFNKEMENAIISYKGYTPADFVIPMLRYFGKRDALFSVMKYCLNPSNNPVKRIKGYEAVTDLSWHNDLDKVKKKMKYYEVKVDTPTLALMERYLQECKANGIKVLLLYSPEYIEGQRFTHNRQDVIDFYKKISAKYDVPYFDFSNDSMSYQQKYFFNAEHLNKLGADLFTRKLIDTLKKSTLLQGLTPITTTQ
jgi:hypothetical protein